MTGVIRLAVMLAEVGLTVYIAFGAVYGAGTLLGFLAARLRGRR